MEFNSLIFLTLFFPAFLLIFFGLRRFARNIFMLLASLVFYALGEGMFALLLLVSILGNYGIGLLVDRGRSRGAKKAFFVAGLVFNLGLLVVFKYTHFILGNLGISLPGLSIPLPAGISFYTFQAVSFLVDTYRKTVSFDKNPVRFGLYMALFPRLITGPIIPYHDLSKQILRDGFTWEGFGAGARRFILGLGKKVLIADTVAWLADSIFAVPGPHLTAGLAWIGILAYTIQIYFDFSGYTDMAIGVGRMCGFTLPENFNYPYIARNVKDFWTRWHISLARWLRDYLFLPIAYAVSRRIKKDKVLGIRAESWAYSAGAFFTFLLCGVWHGAAWTFIIWGAFYGIMLVLEHAGLRKLIKKLWSPLQVLYCQFLVVFAWVFFRSPDLVYARTYLKAMFGFGGGDHSVYYPALYLNPEVMVIGLLGIAGSFPLIPELKKLFEKIMTPGNILRGARVSVTFLFFAALLAACILVLVSGTYRPFIYFRF